MERISFEIERQEVADTLHGEAEANGRSIEAEVAALVERTYTPVRSAADESRARIDRLIRSAKGVGFDPPPRQTFVVDQPKL